MKKKYYSPEVEVLYYNRPDIITGSNDNEPRLKNGDYSDIEEEGL